MLTLVITACLATNMARCEDMPVPGLQATSMIGCHLAAEIEAAQWQENHPRWVVTKKECKPVG